MPLRYCGGLFWRESNRTLRPVTKFFNLGSHLALEEAQRSTHVRELVTILSEFYRFPLSHIASWGTLPIGSLPGAQKFFPLAFTAFHRPQSDSDWGGVYYWFFTLYFLHYLVMPFSGVVGLTIPGVFISSWNQPSLATWPVSPQLGFVVGHGVDTWMSAASSMGLNGCQA
jgi:hypothetical protein